MRVSRSLFGLHELSNTYLERILRDKAVIADAAQLIQPLRTIGTLRNAAPPYHTFDDRGRKAFEEIGHPWPVKNPATCWDDVCKLYVDALDAITTALQGQGYEALSSAPAAPAPSH